VKKQLIILIDSKSKLSEFFGAENINEYIHPFTKPPTH